MNALPSSLRAPSILDRLSGWRAAFLAEMARWDHMQRTIDELRALSDRELADLGIARCDIRRLARESVYGA